MGDDREGRHIARLESGPPPAELALIAADLATWSLDFGADIVHFSARWFELIGRPAEAGSLRVEALRALVHPKDIADVDARLAIARRSPGSAFDVQHRIRSAAGAWIWIHSKGRVTDTDGHGHARRIVGTSAEITQYKLTEELLAQSKRDMALVLRNIPASVVMFDENLRVRFANHAYAELVGVPEADLPGRPLSSLIGAEAFAEVAPRFEASLAGRANSYERQVGEPGAPRWIEVNVLPASRDGRRVDGCFTLGLDVTQKKQHELELERSESRFRALTALSSDWYWEQDEDFRFTLFEGVSQQARPGELSPVIGKTRWEVGYTNLTPADWDEHRAVLERHEPFSGFVGIRRDTATGNPVAWEVAGEPIFDKAGAFRGYRGIGRDVTKRVRAEVHAHRQQVRAERAEATLRTALDALDDGFVLYDRDDRLVVCNERYREFYAEARDLIVPGVPFEEVVRAGVEAGAYPAASGRGDAWMEERLAVHRSATGSVEQQRRDGRWIRIAERRTPDGGTVGFRVDITELKTALMRIRQEEELAEQLFSGAVMGANIRSDSVRSLIRPASMFSGDVVLTAHSPQGSLHALVGDFTGHGLSAAIGALPVAGIFRSMTAKGLRLAEIAREINRKLRLLLPRGYFLAATLLEVHRDLEEVEVCNCGMPALVVSSGDAVEAPGVSRNVPLGVVDASEFEPEVDSIAVRAGGRLVCASDGFFEAFSESHEQFGFERFSQALRRVARDDSAIPALEAALDRHRGNHPLLDDATIVEFHLDDHLFSNA